MSFPDSSIIGVESETKFLGVKPIDIPEDKLQLLKQVLNSSRVAPMTKETIQKKITGMCSLCGGIAQHIASYDYNGATKIERYCSVCVEKQFSRA